MTRTPWERYASFAAIVDPAAADWYAVDMITADGRLGYELRTPLNDVLGYTQRWKRRTGPRPWSA